MAENKFLLIPGPTQIPNRVLTAGAQPMVSHRSGEFVAIFNELRENCKSIFKTKEEVLIMTCSGSGSMEAALINFLRRGDKVLAVSVGNFGDRWRDIAEAYGFQVDYLSFPWGQAADPQAIADKLAADVNKEIKAILVQHHETSTGVYNPLPEISRVRGDHPALLMVDAISGLAACPLEMDAWGLDVVVASSQKALMTPPGLSLIGVSQKAWAAAENSDIPKFYLDLKKAKKYAADGQTPFTPAVSLVYAMNEAVKMIVEEGVDQTIARHYRRRDVVRAALQAMGLRLLADESCAGGVLTAFYTPENIPPKALTTAMNQSYQVAMAGGMGKLKPTTLRFAHLGYMRDLELAAGIVALEMALLANGYSLQPGAAIAAAEGVWGRQ